MHAQHFTTLGTGPALLFIPDKLPDTSLPYVHEVLDHAHAVPGPVAFVQAVQHYARKAAATEAVPGLSLRSLCTIFDFTCNAGLRFKTVVAPAAGACLFFPDICPAEAAVHSTGSDQYCGNRSFLFRFHGSHGRGSEKTWSAGGERSLPCLTVFSPGNGSALNTHLGGNPVYCGCRVDVQALNSFAILVDDYGYIDQAGGMFKIRLKNKLAQLVGVCAGMGLEII